MPIPPVPDEYIKLPPRESIFMVYNDVDLERAIIARLIQDRIVDLQTRIAETRATLKVKMDPLLKTDPKEIAAALAEICVRLFVPETVVQYRLRGPPRIGGALALLRRRAAQRHARRRAMGVLIAEPQ